MGSDLSAVGLVKLEVGPYGIVARVAPFNRGHRDEQGETFGPWRDARPWEAVHYESWPPAAVWTARYSDAGMAWRRERDAARERGETDAAAHWLADTLTP